MARWIFVTLITALLSSCGRHGADRATQEDWSAEQLQAFEQFKSDATARPRVVESIARSFPATFNHADRAISQQRWVELLGRPSVSFSSVERPEYLAGEGPPQDFDPRELHILLYDVDCLMTGDGDVCSHLEVIALKQRVLRVRLLHGRREESVALLSEPATPPVRPEHSRLIAEMPRAGWRQVARGRAQELAKQFGGRSLDSEFYEHGDGDVVYGRIVAPMQLIKTSASESVCIADAEDIFVPSLQQDPRNSAQRRAANLRLVVFAASIEACAEAYRGGQFVRLTGESLAATQLAGIHDLFVRRFAAECDVPSWLTPNGLMPATGGSYRIAVAPPASGRDRWSFEVAVDFSVPKGGNYSAQVAISPWGTRLKGGRQTDR
ncbi:hypothetical protein JM946_23830 [Steroidobacter sp. S1-65]|uniref:Lipoprotein n=1 Tax=Steroidobacter gossypii TaxID=2805490 RepID=A0ABS1X3G4_9GAMM|nr:hypothetical protein [Steroidobacter gossypii]MBM0107776.1 hypothetical protein [Steroidobacter gossypii]